VRFAKKEAVPVTLEARIHEIQEACDKYLDGKALELKLEAPGVPLGVLRNILTARSNGCSCAAALGQIALED
jgi:hypothetical protein